MIVLLPACQWCTYFQTYASAGQCHVSHQLIGWSAQHIVTDRGREETHSNGRESANAAIEGSINLPCYWRIADTGRVFHRCVNMFQYTQLLALHCLFTCFKFGQAIASDK